MSKIIVAVDESQGSSDAIALASTLAGITGSTLTLVNVFPYDVGPSRASNREFEEYLRQDSRELLERLRDAHGDEAVELKPIANTSPAHGLHDARRAGGCRPDRGRLHAHRPRRPGAAGEHRRAAPARSALPGRRGAQRLRAASGPAARGHRLCLRRLPVVPARARGGRPARGGNRGAVAGHPGLRAADVRPPAGQHGLRRNGLVQRHAARARRRRARGGGREDRDRRGRVQARSRQRGARPRRRVRRARPPVHGLARLRAAARRHGRRRLRTDSCARRPAP